MSAISSLQKMSGVAEKLSSASDLMQNSANAGETAHDIKVKEKANKTGKSTKPAEPTTKAQKEKGQPMTSRSKTEANAVSRHNMLNQKAIAKHFTAANDSQEARQDKQINLAQQQALSMKQLHSTMQDILRVLERDKNKITPKTQEFAKSKGFADIVGEAKNGMIDKIGSLLGDLMGDFKDKLGSLSDLLGGGKDKKGKKRRSARRDRARAKRREAARIRAGGPPGGGPNPGGGWWSNAGQRIGGALRSGASTVREGLRGGHGKGVGGLLLKGGAIAATAYGGSKVGEWLNGKLGGVSASEESGKGGVGTVSTGKGDNGGVSYGTHQLSSKTGTMASFLQSQEGQPYAQQMSGLQPGSAAFNEAYKKVAANDGEGFAAAQEKFITRTHYAPQERKVSEATGMDFSRKGKAVQEMLYSTGVQYGPNSGVVAAALKGKAVANMSDSEIINTVQDYKAATVGRYFSSSSGDIQASIANRAQREKGKLLAVDKQALEGKAAGDDPAVTAKGAAAVAAPMTEVAAIGKPTQIGPKIPSLAALSTVNGVAPSAAPATQAVAATEPTPEESSGVMPAVAATGAAALTAATLLPARAAPTPGFAPPSRTTLPEPTVPKPAVVATPMTTSPNLPAANEPHMAGKGLTTGVEAGAKGVAKAGARSGIGSKVLPGANILLGGLDAYDVVSNEETSRAEKEKALSGVGGGMAGAWAGGAAGTAGGAAIGAGIGSLFFGIGAVPGAAIGAGLGFVGGAAGSYLGYTYGSEAGEAAYDAVRGTPEEQAAAAEAKAGTGVVAGSTPLMMLTQQRADETGDPTAVKAAAAMKTVDEAIKKATSAATVAKDEDKKDAEKDKVEAKAAAAPITPAAVPPVESAGAVASSSPQTPGDMTTMLAGAATTGVAAGLAAGAPSVPGSPGTPGAPGAEGGMLAAMTAGLGLPPGWAASIAAGYGGAAAVQAAAMAGAPIPTAAAAAPIAGQSMLPMPNTQSPNVAVSAPTPTNSFAMPVSQPAPPVVTAPSVSQPVAPTSPASPEFYKDTDISPSASALAAKTQASASSISRASNAPTTVSSAVTAPQPIERQQYEPVKSVMMIEPKTQDTMMPQRFSKESDKIPSKGVSEGGSIRQTIDDCPVVISDQGLVLLQTGFI